MPEKKPKLGDKYAIMSAGGQDASGPFYVVSIRGFLVALGFGNKPDHKASRHWRIESDGRLRNTTRWSMQHAEPWTAKHVESKRRQSLQYKVGSLFDAHRRGGYEKLDMTQLLSLLKILNTAEETDAQKEGKETKATDYE